MIRSRSNSQVKEVRRWQRDKRQRARDAVFVAEGTRWLVEALATGVPIRSLYYTADWAATPDHAALLGQASAVATPVSPEVMGAMSDTRTPPGILAVLTQPEWVRPARLERVLVLDGVGDPGNVGTMIRTAVAAAVDAVLVGPGSVDLFNPKVVRASMGAVCRLPVLTLDWSQIGNWVRGLDIWLASAHGERGYDQVDWSRPAALIIGSEAHGPGPEAASLATGRIQIPMAPGVESLNAAVAASTILLHAYGQLRRPRDVTGDSTGPRSDLYSE